MQLGALVGQLSKQALRAVAQPLLQVREVGSPGHRAAREHIVGTLAEAGFAVELDTFTQETVVGAREFSSIVATLHPHARQRLVLAAHYDSKLFLGQEFVGATDSAIPCAILLQLGIVLAPLLAGPADTTLQLIFFDGEEAFGEWTASDSLYGARHLAARMAGTLSGPLALAGVRLLVLLDLLGARDPYPQIRNFFPETNADFLRLAAVERRLHQHRLLQAHPAPFFRPDLVSQRVEDDHVPFVQRGVRVVHAIAVPFPRVWHTPADSHAAVDYDVAASFLKIFAVFAAEYLGAVP